MKMIRNHIRFVLARDVFARSVLAFFLIAGLGAPTMVCAQEEDDISRLIKAGEKLLGDAQPLRTGRLSTKSGPQSGNLQAPSTGLAVFERMGAALPPLPPEKAYTGKVDPAFGAFQRGYYLTAIELALPKAQTGDASAQTLLAEMLANGLGIKQNLKDAVFWYEQGARGGDANAQFKYALMLMEGRLIARDKTKADQMMRKAADGGNALAQFNIAQIMVAATPGEEGLKQALPFYEKAAIGGIADAQYALAELYITLDMPREKRATARQWLEKSAKAGFDTAQYQMGVWLMNGIGGERDLEAGFLWMKRAARGGHVLAQNKLAHLYINAIGTGPDPVEAVKWYVLSRRAGLKDLELEDFYLGISEDQQKAGVSLAESFRR